MRKNQTKKKNHEQENIKYNKPADFESFEPQSNREGGNYTYAIPMAPHYNRKAGTADSQRKKTTDYSCSIAHSWEPFSSYMC